MGNPAHLFGTRRRKEKAQEELRMMLGGRPRMSRYLADLTMRSAWGISSVLPTKSQHLFNAVYLGPSDFPLLEVEYRFWLSRAVSAERCHHGAVDKDVMV